MLSYAFFQHYIKLLLLFYIYAKLHNNTKKTILLKLFFQHCKITHFKFRI